MYLRISVIFAIAFLIVGCQQTKNESALPDQESNNKFIQVENSTRGERQNLSNTDIAHHLANLAGQVPDVYDAVAVVAGPYAVVGINVDKNLDRSRVGTIKYSVTEALRHDPYGKTAVVVADGDITERIRGMADKIQQGYPVQGVVDELAAIVGRYMPTVPVPEHQPKEPDQNKEQLPAKEERNLDKIQDEQSNDMMDKER